MQLSGELLSRGAWIETIAPMIRFAKTTRETSSGVLVNIFIDRAQAGADAADFVKNRIAMQQEHIETIWEKFASVRSLVPLYETEIRGVPMLSRLSDSVFA